jgi:integrase/recombinase XerD
MREHPRAGMSLYGRTGRKYLNAGERKRFIETARQAPPEVRLFCFVLRWSGGRISEVLALTAAAIDIDGGMANIETLKRRRRGLVRQVPLPPDVLDLLDQFFGLRLRQRDPELADARLWTWSRTTAWRRVKEIMAAAGITGSQATPKGLRHAFQSNVPPHLVQRWLGHASLRTTAIYGDVIGPEERAFAGRMWASPKGRDTNCPIETSPSLGARLRSTALTTGRSICRSLREFARIWACRRNRGRSFR